MHSLKEFICAPQSFVNIKKKNETPVLPFYLNALQYAEFHWYTFKVRNVFIDSDAL